MTKQKKTCQCLNKSNRTWDVYVKTVAVFSNDETVIVLVNTGVMVTSFLLGNNIFFPLYFAQLVSIFGINLSAFGENPVMGYWRGTDLQVSHSNPVKAPIYPLIHDISGVFVSKLLDTQQKPHQGIKNKTQTWIL